MARWQNVLEIIGVTPHHTSEIMNAMALQHHWHGFEVGYLTGLTENDALLAEIKNWDGDWEAMRQDPLVELVIIHLRVNIADVVSKLTRPQSRLSRQSRPFRLGLAAFLCKSLFCYYDWKSSEWRKSCISLVIGSSWKFRGWFGLSFLHYLWATKVIRDGRIAWWEWHPML